MIPSFTTSLTATERLFSLRSGVRKIFFLFALFLAYLPSALAQVPTAPVNDSAAGKTHYAYPLCYLASVGSPIVTNATNDVFTGGGGCGAAGTAYQGLWYIVYGNKPGNALITVNGVSANLKIRVEVHTGAPGGPVMTAGCAAALGGSVLVPLTGIVKDQVYYVLVASVQPVLPAATHSGGFSISIDSSPSGTDVVVGQATPQIQVDYRGIPHTTKFNMCHNPPLLEDRMIKVHDTTQWYRGGRIKSWIEFQQAGSALQTDTLIGAENPNDNHGVDTVRAIRGASIYYKDIIDSIQNIYGINDSIDVVLKTQNQCGIPHNPPLQQKLTILLQRPDVKCTMWTFRDSAAQHKTAPGFPASGDTWNSLGWNCKMDTAYLHIFPAITPPLRKWKPGSPGIGDSAQIDYYIVKVWKPRKDGSPNYGPQFPNVINDKGQLGPDSVWKQVPIPPKYDQLIKYPIPANTYGQFKVSISAVAADFCDSVFAYLIPSKIILNAGGFPRLVPGDSTSSLPLTPPKTYTPSVDNTGKNGLSLEPYTPNALLPYGFTSPATNPNTFDSTDYESSVKMTKYHFGFNVLSPPKVDQITSTNVRTGPFQLSELNKTDSICPGDSAFIQLKRKVRTYDSFGNPIYWGGKKLGYQLQYLKGPSCRITNISSPNSRDNDPDPFLDHFVAGAANKDLQFYTDSTFRIDQIVPSAVYDTIKFGVRLIDENGSYMSPTCDTIISLIIKPKVKLLVSSSKPGVCAGDSVTLQAKPSNTGRLAIQTYHWSQVPHPPSPSEVNPSSTGIMQSNPFDPPVSNLGGVDSFYVYTSDQSQCFSDTVLIKVTVNNPPVDTMDYRIAGHAALNVGTVCVGKVNTFDLIGRPNGVNYVYQWSSSRGSFLGLGNSNPEQLTLYDSATVCLLVTAVNGNVTCPGDIVCKKILPQPRATLNPPVQQIYCQQDQFTINPNITGLTGTSVLAWTALKGGVNVTNKFQPINGATPIITPTVTLPTGTYTFSVLDQDSNTSGNCDTTMQFSIEVKPSPQIFTVDASPATICENNPVTFTVTGDANGVADHYDWSMGKQGTTVTDTIKIPSASTTYTVTATIVYNNNAVCTADSFVTVTINANPVVPSVAGTNDLCASSSATYSYSVPNPQPGVNYTWDIPGGNVTPQVGNTITNIKWTAGGNYVITVTAQSATTPACSAPTSAFFPVKVNALPSVDTIIGNSRPCQGATAVYTVKKPIPGSVYSFTQTNNTNPITVLNSTSISITWNTLVNNDTIHITQQTSSGCLSIGQGYQVVNVYKYPDAPIVYSDPVCAGSTGNAISVKDSLGVQYTWATNDPTKIHIQNPSLSATTFDVDPAAVSGGVYEISVTQKSIASGCKLPPAFKTITVNDARFIVVTNKAAVEAPVYCEGDVVHLQINTNGATVSATSDAGVNSGSFTSIGSPVVTGIDYLIKSGGGKRTETLTFGNSIAGCASALTTVTINIQGVPTVTIQPIASGPYVCQHTPIELNAVTSVNAPDVTYLWTASDSIGLNGGTFSDPTALTGVTYTPAAGEVGTTKFTLTYGNGACPSATQVTQIFYEEEPIVATITPADVKLCDNLTTTLDATVSTSKGKPSFIWNVVPAAFGTVNGQVPPYNAAVTFTPTPIQSLSIDSQSVQITCTYQGQYLHNGAPVCAARPCVVKPIKVYAAPRIQSPGSAQPGMTVCQSTDISWAGASVRHAKNVFWTVDYTGSNNPFRVPSADTIKNVTVTNPNFASFVHDTSTGAVKFTMVASNANGCKATPSYTVVFVPQYLPVIIQTLNDPFFCAGEKVAMASQINLANGGVAPSLDYGAKLKWTATETPSNNITGSFSPTDVDPTPTFNSSASYDGLVTFKLEVNSSYCPTTSYALAYTAQIAPNVYYTVKQPGPVTDKVPQPVKVCQSDSLITFYANNISPYSVMLADAQGSGLGSLDADHVKLDEGKIVIRPSGGDLNLTFTVYNIKDGVQGCAIHNQPFNVAVIQKPSLIQTNGELCQGDEVHLHYKLNDPRGYQIADLSADDPSNLGGFDPGSQVSDPEGDVVYHPSASEKQRENLTFKLTPILVPAKDFYGCTAPLFQKILPLNVKIPPVLSIEFGGGLDSVSTNQGSIVLTGSVLPKGISPYFDHPKIKWTTNGFGKFSPDDTSHGAASSVVTYFPSDADFQNRDTVPLRFYFTLSGTCRDTYIEKHLKIRNIHVTNVLGPEGVFRINGLPEGSRLQIFDRWGKTVFGPELYDNKWQPLNVPGGTYYYVLTYRLGELKGFFQVLK